MNKKRIFFLIPVLKGGGAERNIINLIANMDTNVYELTIVAGNVGGNLESELGSNVKLINLESSGFLQLFFKLSKLLKSKQPDILVSALPHINTLSMMVKSFSSIKTKVILTEHTTISSLSSTARTLVKRLEARFILPPLMKMFYPSANKIICVSEGVKEDLLSIIGNVPSIQVIYNPVFSNAIDLLRKEPLGEDEQLFTKGSPVIIAVGRLIKAKDYPTLLKAFKLMLGSLTADLVILGEGPEDEYLKNLVTSLSLQNNVTFLGFKSNPYKYMARSSVFVLSSVREGFGNVIVEAMGCGVPVVATNCKSGPSEIINNNINGLLVEPQNPKALADGITGILKDAALAQTLSVNGKERAAYFSIEKSVAEYEKVFEDLLHE